MQIYTVVSVIVILSGSAISFLLAVEQVTGQKFSPRTLFRIVHLIASAIFLLGIGLIPLKIQMEYPLSGFLFTTSVFMAGPSNLLYHRTLLYPDEPGVYRYKKYLVLPAIALAVDVLFQLLPGELQQVLLYELFEEPISSKYTLVFLFGGLYNIFFHSMLLRIQLASARGANIKRGILIITIQNVFAVLCVAPLLLGFIFKLWFLYLGTAVAMVIPQFLIMLTQNRYSEFFNLLTREMDRVKYRRSRLRHIDLDALHRGLHRLMETEKIYEDFDLTIQSMAERLFVAPEQLSQFLNENYGLEFRNFINRYRVNEAIRLIRDNPEQSITSICYQAGFSSKSSFYEAFKKFTGLTPVAYRNKHAESGKITGP